MPDNHEIRTRLAALPGVRDVRVSSYPERVTVVVDPVTTPNLVGETIRSLLRAEALGDPAVEVTVGARPDRRSRFISLETCQPAPGRFAARVTLEWDGRQIVGNAEGERNHYTELKICAAATLRAVEAIASQRVSFNVIGVKELSVFDHHLVVILVLSPELPGQRLIGNAIVSEDRATAAADRVTAAALAALNATNRIIGRFIND